jgi:hypothetical protein
LKLQNAIDERLGGRRAARHIDIDRDDAVATGHDRIAIVIGPAPFGTALRSGKTVGMRPSARHQGDNGAGTGDVGLGPVPLSGGIPSVPGTGLPSPGAAVAIASA